MGTWSSSFFRDEFAHIYQNLRSAVALAFTLVHNSKHIASNDSRGQHLYMYIHVGINTHMWGRGRGGSK